MRKKLCVNEIIIVEGRYDAVALASIVDGLIIPTHGFSVFADDEKKELIRTLAKKRGVLILTDSDAAGFKIRNYVQKIAAGCSIKHAYIPEVQGKEKRKAVPSREGTLGVEGMPPDILLECLERAGVYPRQSGAKDEITHTDLYEWGLSGTQGSAVQRRELLVKLGLPTRLSKRALCSVLSSLYTKKEIGKMVNKMNDGAKPVLFWDFHGTLTLPDFNWLDAAIQASLNVAPQKKIDRQRLIENLSASCLPWFTIESRDTRSLTAPGAWWAHCEENFTRMYIKSGYSEEEARVMAPKIRDEILDIKSYKLYDDTASTLKTLQKKGYRSYILSNNFPELESIVEQLGLLPYFEKVIVSAKVGFDKPRREIFEEARRQAQNPKNCWMIGDNVQDDIEGGNVAGFTTVAVHGADAPSADYRIDNLAEILDVLDNYV